MSDLTPHYNIEHYHFRQQWMLLGLPFDAVTLDQACDRVFEAIEKRQRCFISTPNLNFVINAKRDPEFAKSVFLSDLNLADGMPLVWAARWLKIPIPERVAGSSLFDELVKRSHPDKPVKVFFFGGDPGVAEKASIVLNNSSDAVVCCGYHDPGRGDVASMSTPDVIDKVNASNADFLVVSLGAKKGQAWIQHNLAQLNVPVVSHLGAVVNFVAGTVKRAPKIWQKLGLEWLWRIVEEPYLWKRYATDGLAALKMAGGVITQRFSRTSDANPKAECEAEFDNKIKVVLSGRPTERQLQSLYNALNVGLRTDEKTIQTIEILLDQADMNCPELQAFIQIIEATTEASGIYLTKQVL
ncbi:WecB/TagA/CpsF family glycosyltransferase [Nitrincola schmidtii]|uniref:WecB/TagA/CpsF family glycosyltransferase n=1 Tax=Nitrincola schmidtii TaxID=1730894 RepID=UPI00198173EC|nr:WecB/TagA/CpsF family glycosyltransferase [Nitrincola schmidtii]